MAVRAKRTRAQIVMGQTVINDATRLARRAKRKERKITKIERESLLAHAERYGVTKGVEKALAGKPAS
mgnify:CR=1 FL=1